LFLKSLLCLIAILSALAIVACGDDDDDSDAGDGQDQPAATTGVDDDADDAEDGDDAADEDGEDAAEDGDDEGGGGGPIAASLTIGDETWEFASVGCVFSAEEAQNPDFPFNLSAFGESSTGARTQLSADIYDPSGQERHEGDGVTHHISLHDIDDFENPSVAWDSVSGALAGGAETVLQVDGKNVHGEGVFDDDTTDEIENVPGTLEVTCP
jgi:hypothetical protein